MAFRMASFSPVSFWAFLEAGFIGLEIAEFERIGRFQLGIDDFIARFQQQVDTRSRTDAEVMTTLRADVEIRFEISLEDHLIAAVALDPETFSADCLLSLVLDFVLLA